MKYTNEQTMCKTWQKNRRHDYYITSKMQYSVQKGNFILCQVANRHWLTFYIKVYIKKNMSAEVLKINPDCEFSITISV